MDKNGLKSTKRATNLTYQGNQRPGGNRGEKPLDNECPIEAICGSILALLLGTILV